MRRSTACGRFPPRISFAGFIPPIIRLELLTRQAEQKIVVEAAVEEDMPTTTALLNEAELLVQRDRGVVAFHTGRIAFLVAPFQKRIPEQDAGGILGVSFPPVGTADTQAHAEGIHLDNTDDCSCSFDLDLVASS